MKTRTLAFVVYGALVAFALAWAVPAALLAPLPDPDEDYNTAGFLVRHSWVKFAGVATSPFRDDLSAAEEDERIARFFELNRLIADAERVAGDPASSEAAAASGQSDAELMRQERSDIENSVEWILEGRLTDVLKDAGLTRDLGHDVIWPPVNIEFEEPPAVLVTSPRDRIERGRDRLLQSGLPVDDRVRIETEKESDGETSALVVNIGAIAMYPAIVPPRADYRSTLQTVAHEWVHHYLYWTPLGRSFYASDKLSTLNETVANIAGDELGDIMWARYPLDEAPALVSIRPLPAAGGASGGDTPAFDFGAEMRRLRLDVDALLQAGEVEQAERLMEERRQTFVENDYYIRRINQAYFAFHGTYADTPASSDPIGPKMLDLRDRSASIEQFLEAARELESEQDLDQALGQ